MTSTVSVPYTPLDFKPSSASKLSWQIQSNIEMVAWLETSAERLELRAQRDVSAAARLLRLAAQARDAADWYAAQRKGGRR